MIFLNQEVLVYLFLYHAQLDYKLLFLFYLRSLVFLDATPGVKFIKFHSCIICIIMPRNRHSRGKRCAEHLVLLEVNMQIMYYLNSVAKRVLDWVHYQVSRIKTLESIRLPHHLLITTLIGNLY